LEYFLRLHYCVVLLASGVGSFPAVLSLTTYYTIYELNLSLEKALTPRISNVTI